MSEETAQKLRRVRALLGADLDAIVLRRTGSVAWLSGGGRTHISSTSPIGVAAVVVHPDTVTVVTAVNEADRLAREELGGLDATWTVLPWDTDLTTELPDGPRIGTDLPYGGCRDVAGPLEAARRSLTVAEADRYRALGADAAVVLTDVCQRTEPNQSEYEAAAAVAAGLIERAIDPVVLLVAGAERLPHHRHPLPTGAVLGDLAMIVACGRRQGLIVSLTRFVSHRRLDPETTERYHRLLLVDGAFNDATRTGATVGEVFQAGAGSYAGAGFDPEEWHLHHQGGPTGYATREWLATAASEAMIEERQAFAWNPSVAGLKCEDTVIAHAGPPEVLTVDPRWPTTLVEGLARPLILEV
ncbi:MAG: peptidase M24 [Actinomycetota bacterium]|nr:peptidase M24 [Actinomycetota bacterium]